MKLLRIAVLFLMASVCLTAWSTTYSGSCGPNAFWEFNTTTKRLSITGRGEMNDYSLDNVPWKEYRSQVEYISISYGITKIGKRAFFSCNFSSVDIPSSVIRIEEDAFFSCDNLSSVWIPSSVSYLDAQAFYGCDKLSAINVSSDNPNYTSINGVVFSKDKTKLCLFPSGRTGSYSVPEHVTCIGSYAFVTSLISTVQISNSVREIEDGAFTNAKLTSITIPNSISKINSRVFLLCFSLESVTIPNSVKEIGGSAFGYCSKLAHVYIQSQAGSVVVAADAFPETTQIHYTGATGSSTSSTAKKPAQSAPAQEGLSKGASTGSARTKSSKPAQQSPSKKPLTK